MATIYHYKHPKWKEGLISVKTPTEVNAKKQLAKILKEAGLDLEQAKLWAISETE